MVSLFLMFHHFSKKKTTPQSAMSVVFFERKKNICENIVITKKTPEANLSLQIISRKKKKTCTSFTFHLTSAGGDEFFPAFIKRAFVIHFIILVEAWKYRSFRFFFYCYCCFCHEQPPPKKIRKFWEKDFIFIKKKNMLGYKNLVCGMPNQQKEYEKKKV